MSGDGMMADGHGDGQISVSQAVECLEHMEYVFDGEPEELVRSVVPAAAQADGLSLEDAMKVILNP